MSVILILIMASLTLAGAFLVCFIWAVKSGQFDDTLTPSMRILTDEDKPQSSSSRQAMPQRGARLCPKDQPQQARSAAADASRTPLRTGITQTSI